VNRRGLVAPTGDPSQLVMAWTSGQRGFLREGLVTCSHPPGGPPRYRHFTKRADGMSPQKQIVMSEQENASETVRSAGPSNQAIALPIISRKPADRGSDARSAAQRTPLRSDAIDVLKLKRPTSWQSRSRIALAYRKSPN